MRQDVEAGLNEYVYVLDYSFLGATLGEWLWVVALWAVIALVLVFLNRLLVWRLEAMAERTERLAFEVSADIFRKTKLFFLVLVALYVAAFVVAVPETVERVLSTVAFIALMIQFIIWGNAVLSRYVAYYRDKKIEEDAAAVMTVQAMGFMGRLVLYSIILLLALDNFGVQVTALVAGLGVGGIAVALALQNILGDLFASLSIVLDKPFVVGDFLIVGDFLGTVEYVGLKTTRVRSLSGEQIVFSNNDLLNSRIRNFKRMFERRVVFSVGVTYQTPHELLSRIPEEIRRIVESKEQARFDRSHFARFGESAFEFETVYFVTVPEFNTYMDVQQAINLDIVQYFEENGIEFAYPTRTLHVQPVSVEVDDVETPTNAQ